MIKVGIGHDVHAFSRDRKLVIGGVDIPFEMGLSGHSDADVLTHAICDALLGALGEGDIGLKFPDNDPKYKNIRSLELLKNVCGEVERMNYRIYNVDSIVVAQAPKIQPFVPEMKKTLAGCLGIGENFINIKATTTEGLGFAGRKEGISAFAVALIMEKDFSGR
ncbi:2-C-methyl-D-erythritol 2,4-cyclodiphosphate synthase [bacterium]|jgi:2-C-methyl-D-erythritol 2,4-cyclodiphosphate synthase|nr:2-C-methyl-D-erythritol 2,4-cyclodiphosphate synthase [bacterium]